MFHTTFSYFLAKQKVQMWCNYTFPQLHVLFIIYSLLPDDPVNCQKNLDDVSSSVMSKTIPLGTIKTVLALALYFVGRELEARLNWLKHEKTCEILRVSAWHMQNYVYCFDVWYEASVVLILLFLVAGLLAFTVSRNVGLPSHIFTLHYTYSRHAFCNHILRHLKMRSEK